MFKQFHCVGETQMYQERNFGAVQVWTCFENPTKSFLHFEHVELLLPIMGKIELYYNNGTLSLAGHNFLSQRDDSGYIIDVLGTLFLVLREGRPFKILLKETKDRES